MEGAGRRQRFRTNQLPHSRQRGGHFLRRLRMGRGRVCRIRCVGAYGLVLQCDRGRSDRPGCGVGGRCGSLPLRRWRPQLGPRIILVVAKYPTSGRPSYVHADQHAIVFHPDYDGVNVRTMFSATDGGVFRTDNPDGIIGRTEAAICDPGHSVVRFQRPQPRLRHYPVLPRGPVPRRRRLPRRHPGQRHHSRASTSGAATAGSPSPAVTAATWRSIPRTRTPSMSKASGSASFDRSTAVTTLRAR